MPVQAKPKRAVKKKTTKTALPRKRNVAKRQNPKKPARPAPTPKTVTSPKPKHPKPARSAVLRAAAAKGGSGLGPSKPALSSSRIRTQAPGPKYFFSTDIPDHYGETYMRALPRDPVWIFSYWEISQGTINGMKTVLGEAFKRGTWVLRVSDVTDIEYNGKNAWRSMDINISLSADNWYIKIWEPGRVYLIQAGLLTQDGVFSEAVRSNAVRMPHAGVSAIVDEEWLTSESDELIRMSALSLKRGIGASERMEESELGAGLAQALGQGSGSGSIL